MTAATMTLTPIAAAIAKSCKLAVVQGILQFNYSIVLLLQLFNNTDMRGKNDLWR